MAWCPVCKNEYQEGITVCADCGATLVDELPVEKEMAVVSCIGDEALAAKFVEYLKYSAINAEYQYLNTEKSYGIIVDKANLEAARVAFRAFYNVESRNQMLRDIAEASEVEGTEDTDENTIVIDENILEAIPDEDLSQHEKEALAMSIAAERVYKPAETYVKKADVSKDMFSTAITFLAFGLLLLILLLLNVMKIMTYFSSIASMIILGAMAIGCCIVGINAIKRSRNAEIASVEEEKLTAALTEWLQNNIDDSTFAELEYEFLSDEVLYLRRTDIIRDKLLEAYPELDENYADALIEEFYDSYFGESD